MFFRRHLKKKFQGFALKILKILDFFCAREALSEASKTNFSVSNSIVFSPNCYLLHNERYSIALLTRKKTKKKQKSQH